ncbi:MAG TPA: hypothetical protein VHM47_02050 [Actinomycetota bacterium]|jgi:hypothetical protein|nr:hypothetical protein [Actinomycetota bacterium]
MQGVDTVRDRPSPVLILGVAALTIHLLVPLLPIHGNGFQFFWSGIPASFLVRWVTDYLVARWSGAVALLFGVWMLRRGHTSVAAGVFVAIAVVVVGSLLNQLIPLPSVVVHSWRADIELGLDTIEATTLFVAASMALRHSS